MAPKREAPEDEPGTKAGSIDELWTLIEGIEIAMLTTRRADGHMVSRPMATQKRAVGADFWFATLADMPKVREITAEPRVNLSYYKDRTREWVSISGEAEIFRDRRKIRELWAPDWKLWFPDEGGRKDGSAEDPRIVLIGVRAVSAEYMSLEKPQALVLFDILASKLAGRTPEMGTVKSIRLSRPRGRSTAAAPASPTKKKTPGLSRARLPAGGRRKK